MTLLTLKNRYVHGPFVGMHNGIEYTVKDTITLPDFIARHLKDRSMIRDNPITGEKDYQLGIVEAGDNVSPLETIPAETLDRTDFDSFRKVKIVPSGIRPAIPIKPDSGGGNAMTSKER